MGRIQINDHKGEWEVTTTSWDGSIELQLDDNVMEVIVSDRSPYSAEDIEITESDDRGTSPLFGDGPTWLLFAPTVLGLLALAVDKLNLLSPFTSSISWAVVVGLYWSFFLVSVFGTLYLYNDAATLTETDRKWQPNPWLYIILGGIAVAGIQTLLVGLPDGSWVSTIPAFAGLFVVGCVVASAVTGPIYLLLRRQHLITDD